MEILEVYNILEVYFNMFGLQKTLPRFTSSLLYNFFEEGQYSFLKFYTFYIYLIDMECLQNVHKQGKRYQK